MSYLAAVQAAAFLRFRSPSGVRNAVWRGELRPIGRGSRQCLLFTMEELQRFVRDRGRRYPSRRVGRPDWSHTMKQKGEKTKYPGVWKINAETYRVRSGSRIREAVG